MRKLIQLVFDYFDPGCKNNWLVGGRGANSLLFPVQIPRIIVLIGPPSSRLITALSKYSRELLNYYRADASTKSRLNKQPLRRGWLAFVKSVGGCFLRVCIVDTR